MAEFKSGKQRIRYINKIRGICDRVEAKKRGSIKKLRAEYDSKHHYLVRDIICEYFGLTLEELLSGKRKDQEPFIKTPEWERLQRSGFHDGAKVPHSHIRKIDK